MNTNIATLRIDDARPSDIGTFLVVGENIAGKDQTSCETFVLNTSNIDERPYIDPNVFKNLEKVPDFSTPEQAKEEPKGKPPKFIIPLPDSLKLFDGEKILTKCKVEGYPLPKVDLNFLFRIIPRIKKLY